jgi:two-component system, cell cycle response regulator DivK
MRRVLVVEDNAINCYMITFLLKKNGYTVIKARDGKTGVALAIKEKPDFVIMDIQLPDINGLEATRRIRESEANGDLPIIALTSYAMVGDKEKALKAGFIGYIEKPIEPNNFLNTIESILNCYINNGT